MSSTSPNSTMRPAYITATRSAISATTPKSWVIMITDMPSFFCRSLSSHKIWAWMVTSRAETASSAISTLGLQDRAMAIMTRCRMPPLISKG